MTRALSRGPHGVEIKCIRIVVNSFSAWTLVMHAKTVQEIGIDFAPYDNLVSEDSSREITSSWV